MSLSLVREQILNFVSKSAPSVMAIKGEWELVRHLVGISFFWKQSVKI